MRHKIVSDGDQSNLDVFIPGVGLLSADSNHPNFKLIAEKVLNDDEDGLVDLFDPTNRVSDEFKALSERVSVSGGRVFFDGDEVDNTLTEQILEFVKQDVADWKPLVKFYENVASNPDEHSKENLYRWLAATKGFTIDADGLIVGYKGVRSNGNGGYHSCNQSGSAIVDGKSVSGAIPNNPGSVVEMPRSKVNHDPAQGCSTGLHIGTWEYAQKFASVVLEVRVNPRDVVSVPVDCDGQKMRACRYTVVGKVTEPYRQAVLTS